MLLNGRKIRLGENIGAKEIHEQIQKIINEKWGVQASLVDYLFPQAHAIAITTIVGIALGIGFIANLIRAFSSASECHDAMERDEDQIPSALARCEQDKKDKCNQPMQSLQTYQDIQSTGWSRRTHFDKMTCRQNIKDKYSYRNHFFLPDSCANQYRADTMCEKLSKLFRCYREFLGP